MPGLGKSGTSRMSVLSWVATGIALLLFALLTTGRGGRHGQLLHLLTADGTRLRGILCARGRHRLEQEFTGRSQFPLEVEIRHGLQPGDLRHSVFGDDALLSVLKTKAHFDLLANGKLAQVGQHHLLVSWNSSTISPTAIRLATRSWHVTQYLAQGTASRRLVEIGSSHSMQTP